MEALKPKCINSTKIKLKMSLLIPNLRDFSARSLDAVQNQEDLKWYRRYNSNKLNNFLLSQAISFITRRPRSLSELTPY